MTDPNLRGGRVQISIHGMTAIEELFIGIPLVPKTRKTSFWWYFRLTLVRFAHDEALHEIYRVLKPGSILGIIWNVEDCM